MIATHGYQSAKVSRTFDTYDHVDCYTYMGIHDVLKLYKHGYSRVTDHATREIRHGRLTRSQGLALVQRYEQDLPQGVDEFCAWLGVTPSSLQFLLDRHRNPMWWREDAPGTWAFEGWSQQQSEPDAPPVDPGFLSTGTLAAQIPGYITIGKGHP
jgi:hypothetical protein